MRRFSSERTLLEPDLQQWRRPTLKEQSSCNDTSRGEPEEVGDGLTRPDSTPVPPLLLTIQEPQGSLGGKGELVKELSFSLENFSELDKAGAYLGVTPIKEGYRAYSDGQLTLGGAGSRENVGQEEQPGSPTCTSSCNPLSSTSLQRSQARIKLAAAKLHLKALFGHQSPHSSNSNLNSEQRAGETSAKERRSRLPFLRQWSQVTHSTGRYSREELDKWAESLGDLLASRSESHTPLLWFLFPVNALFVVLSGVVKK